MNAKMCILVHRLQKNLIRMAKNISPVCVGDPEHIEI